MMTVNSTNYDNVCQQLICFMLSSPITTKNENNRIQCKYSNLWFGTITNIPVNGSQFSKSLQNTNKLGHVFSTQNGYIVIRKVMQVIHDDLVKVLSWWYCVYPLIPVYYIILYNIGRWLKWRKYSIMMQRINHNYR